MSPEALSFCRRKGVVTELSIAIDSARRGFSTIGAPVVNLVEDPEIDDTSYLVIEIQVRDAVIAHMKFAGETAKSLGCSREIIKLHALEVVGGLLSDLHGDRIKADYELQRTDVEKMTAAQSAVETAVSIFKDLDAFAADLARRSAVTATLKPRYKTYLPSSSRGEFRGHHTGLPSSSRGSDPVPGGQILRGVSSGRRFRPEG